VVQTAVKGSKGSLSGAASVQYAAP
jgi:hypothetical protein